MSSKNYLELQRQRVEDAIMRLLPAPGTRPAALNEAIRYSVLSGGKRIRPVLSLAASEAVLGKNGDPDAAMNAAVAIEFLHSYTLIHDDLPAMDNDVIRRGQPTVHVKFGEAMAILAGDALQAYAFDIASRQTALSPERTVQIVHELALAAGPAGVVGGQVEDVDDPSKMTLDRLQYVHQHKTADIFRAALRIGAIAGGGDETAVEAMSVFGQNFGIAFQIIDDLLDAPVNNSVSLPDELNCLRVWSRDEAAAYAKDYTTSAVVALSAISGSPVSAAMTDLAQEMLRRAF